MTAVDWYTVQAGNSIASVFKAASLEHAWLIWQPWLDEDSGMLELLPYHAQFTVYGGGGVPAGQHTISMVLDTTADCDSQSLMCTVSVGAVSGIEAVRDMLLAGIHAPADESTLGGITIGVQVLAYDAAGNKALSDPFIIVVDPTPPVFLAQSVAFGVAASQRPTRCYLQPDLRTPDAAAFAVKWKQATDKESKVVDYAVCLGTAGSPEKFLACRSVGDVRAAVVTTDQLKSVPAVGAEVYATVYAINGVGGRTEAYSESARILCNPEVESCLDPVDDIACV